MAAARDPLPIHVAGHPDTPARHLSVDGMTAAGPNLSHWPGNRTPPELKADLSTGICLNFARAPAAFRSAFLADAEAVVNDHYDTDGFLSMLAIARPDVALAREEILLAAAATGDYQMFVSERAFAIDRIVLNLPRSPASPIASQLAPLSGAERMLACYRWLIEHAEQVLDDPWSLPELFEDELTAVRDELGSARSGAVHVQVHHDCQLSVVRTPAPIRRIVLNTCAAGFRVLHLMEQPDGLRARYHDRTESWFEVVSFSPPPRRDLRLLAARLTALDPDGTGQWCADPPTTPVPELYRGEPEPQEYGEVTRTLTPTRLTAEELVVTFVRFFREPPEKDAERT